ncbi:MAG: glycosyltransferase family 2 protein, partial [Flavobacteriales bacterium]|nr:glycosyltransferase family 2 protein [Flavobacteriales bacterium]
MEVKRLSILVPAFNEEKTIGTILRRLSELTLVNGIEKEIVVVNDCSRDGTQRELDQYISSHPNERILSFTQPVNMGKGAALHKAISLATGEFVVVQDADLEYDPEEFNALLQPVFKADADVVYGSRFIGGNPHRILFYWHSIGNRWLTGLSNMFTNLNLTDMET